ncbi:MAG: hypothetical protein KKH12_10475 [Gammaproteobacteria bacterium]|nr:hypothetical protein [Gammaproteobacteria bacterium]MBU1482086.1 hypothetical protein [Gammaproteobacteria bacterium]
MNQNNSGHHLQIAFKDKHGAAVANAKYELHKSNGEKVTGVTDSNGKSELLESDQLDTIAVWISHKVDELVLAGKIAMRNFTQKPEVVARSVDEPKNSREKTEEHSKKPTKKVELRKYSVLFKVPGYGCTGSVSYRMVQDGKVLLEGKTKGPTARAHTDSESEVTLYIAGDKRYKTGEQYKAEVNDGDVTIPAWVTAKPNTDHRHVENEGSFDKHDWVDVSKIYNQDHPDVTPESKGIYAGDWTPPPKPKEKHRRYEVQVGERKVVLNWIDGSCDDGLKTNGVKTFTSKNDDGWYMTVEEVINRTHPKVFKVLFEVIKELNLTKVDISSSWRPGIGSSAHREGRALDITHVDTATQHADARDNLPGTTTADTHDTPTTTEPALIEKLRLALYNHTKVEQLFDPWNGMFDRNTGNEVSYASQRPVPTSAGLLESDAAFKKRKADIERANSHAKTFAAHRNHLHFHVKLD